MTLEELFKSKDFLVSTNIELALYALAEDFGVPKAEILEGKHDEKFGVAKERIYKQVNKLLEKEKK